MALKKNGCGFSNKARAACVAQAKDRPDKVHFLLIQYIRMEGTFGNGHRIPGTQPCFHGKTLRQIS
jgi:hypothetical protein